MKKLENLKNMYTSSRSFGDLSVQLDFIEALLLDNSIDTIKYHYELLKDKSDTRFFQYLRGAFRKRGEEGKHFLLHMLKTEKNPQLKAEALFILGTMKCEEAKPVAIQFLSKDDYLHQYYGIITLGWLGKMDEIPLLERELINNKNTKLRTDAATALRQIWYNDHRLKKKILKIYHKALSNEQNDDVNRTIIACLQDILRKKFGIKETRYGEISGDANSAKQLAIKALKTFE